MTSLLFRSEALEVQRNNFLGTIRIGRNPGFTVVACVALTLAGALVAFATWGQVTRKARLTGLLVPVMGSVQVSTNTGGVLLDVSVREGDVVESGQTLFVLGTDRKTSAGDIAALVSQSLATRRLTVQAERSARELQARQREQAIADRIRATEAELRQVEAEAQLSARRVALADKTLLRFQQLSQAGFVADLQAQQRQEELIDLQARVQGAERSGTALRRDVQTLQAERKASSLQLKADLAQLDRMLAGVDQEDTENDARKQVVITASQSGVVTALDLKVGQAVQAGQALATLIPRQKDGRPSAIEAQLFAPSRTVGFVQPGQRVWLRFAAYPYQKFGMHGGQISSMSRTPIAQQDLPVGQGSALMTAAQSNEPLYRLSVKLDSQTISTYGKPQPLKPGMALEADVIQDRRAVWEWMLEPVLAASGMARVLGTMPAPSTPPGG